MHQRNSSSSVIEAPSARMAVIFRSSSVISLSTACTATSAKRAVAHDDALDLEARDVLAPAAQVVGLAVDEVEEVVVVDPADVAGVVPPVAAGRDGGLGPAPVALEHDLGALGADDDLAVGVAGQLVVVVVEDADVEVLVVDDAGGVGLVADAGRLPRDEAGLGDAVGAGEGLEAEAVAEDVVDLGRHRGRAEQAEAGVGLGRARLRHLGTVDVVGQQVGHGAEGGGDRGPDPVHLRPEVRHRELAVDGRAAAEHERAEHRGDDAR